MALLQLDEQLEEINWLSIAFSTCSFVVNLGLRISLVLFFMFLFHCFLDYFFFSVFIFLQFDKKISVF